MIQHIKKIKFEESYRAQDLSIPKGFLLCLPYYVLHIHCIWFGMLDHIFYIKTTHTERSNVHISHIILVKYFSILISNFDCPINKTSEKAKKK